MLRPMTHWRVRLQIFISLLCGCMLFPLCGCGAHPASAPSMPSPTSFLAGNWLLFGALPVSGFSNGPGLAMSFDVVGNHIVASANLEVTCGISFGGGFTSGATYGAVLNGTIAPDGGFTLSDPTGDPFTSFTVQGTVPGSAGASWSGKYSFSSTGPSLPNPPPCAGTQTGTFTATPIGDVTGTYTGTSSTFPTLGNSAVNTAVTMSLNLQQGGTLYNPLSLPSIYSRLALAGSIQLQGFSCFSRGATSTTLASEVSGSRISMSFLMDDGSTAELLGSILDTESMRLSIDSLFVRGGQCGGNYLFLFNPLIVQR